MTTISKSPADSVVEMTELVLPNDTNLLGNLLGGKLMHWMDVACGMSASRFANLIFHHPIKLGELVNLKAYVTWSGRTSMEIMVKVFAEDTLNGQIRLANEAFFTFVAVDQNGKPIPVPDLILKDENEKLLYKEAGRRREERLRRKNLSK